MIPYRDLDSLGKKARESSARLNCEKCPIYGRCNTTIMDACDYIYITAFKRGYNKRKQEQKKKGDKK